MYDVIMVRTFLRTALTAVLIVCGILSSNVVALDRHLAMGYRWQHMSNFVFYDENPGLNLHMVEIGYRF